MKHRCRHCCLPPLVPRLRYVYAAHHPRPHTPGAGTVIDTETLVLEVVRSVVESHGKSLTADTAARALGMRPLDAWAAVADTLQIQRTAQQLYEQSEPLLRDR